MGKKEEEIKPLYSQHVEQLLKEQHITGKQLAKMIHTSEQTVSKMRTGLRLSRNNAELINAHFPQYSVAWLLGLTPHRTEEEHEKGVQALKEIFNEAVIKRRAELTITLASLYDFAGFPTEYNSEGMTVTDKSGREVTLSLEELKELEDDIFAFLRYRLNKLMEKGR